MAALGGTSRKWNYPAVRRDEGSQEEFFGTKVADPYRWLEDPDSEDTRAFVEAQNAISEPFLSGSSFRNKIHAR